MITLTIYLLCCIIEVEGIESGIHPGQQSGYKQYSYGEEDYQTPEIEELVVVLPGLEFVGSLTRIEDFPQEVKDFIQSKEETVQIMARTADEAFKIRYQLMKECSCVPNRCSNVLPPDAACGYELGNSTVCEGSRGTMFSMQHGTSGVVLKHTDPTNLTANLKASICLMKHFENEAIPQLQAKKTSTWAYIGTEQGAIWSYPGRLRVRDEEEGLEQWNYCKSYDPRMRPWYHEGAGGPLDIVMVVDNSESMNDPVAGSITRWNIVQDSLLRFMDTITYTDLFNVIFFNNQDSPLLRGLLQGTKENRDKAKEFISNTHPEGATNFEVTFDSAFGAFRAGIESENSTNCNQVILFLTDGKDNDIDRNINRTRDIINKVEGLQNIMEQEYYGQRASIFTFSIGELADDSILRQLACTHNGAWAAISAQDDPLTVFNTFLRFIAAARDKTRIYWSETYEDASGLGFMLTATMPVYTPQYDANVPGALFGVAAHDVLVKDLEKLAGNKTDHLIDILQEQSKICDQGIVNPCLQQVLRGEDVACVDLSYRSASCIKLHNKYYKKFLQPLSWQDAKDECENVRGKIAVPRSKVDQGILAGMAAYEGSWIGLSHDGQGWIWEQPTDLQFDQVWAYGQGNSEGAAIECASIAPSGTSKNIYSHKCFLEWYTYICEFEQVPFTCNEEEVVDLNDPNYYYNMPIIEKCSNAESLDSTRFFDTVKLLEVQPQDLFCHDDFSNPSMPQNFQELFCCPTD